MLLRVLAEKSSLKQVRSSSQIPGQSPLKGSWMTLLLSVMVTFTADTAPVSWACPLMARSPVFT
ncbi:hypothetical protein D3C77_819600 [compost metagenome]